MDIKSAPFTVKAAGPDDGLEEGQFVGYASAFGNADSYGDVVQPGAFKKTLEEWAAKGATIPVLWGHDMSDPFANVTFSGGDPMFQAKGFAELARAIREQSSKSIWCFTGYLFENLVKNPEQLELLRQIDVLVDGPFVQALRDEDLFFRGSSNQRIINVQKSLKEGRVIELNLTTENPNPVL